jgi:hypothetical protein
MKKGWMIVSLGIVMGLGFTEAQAQRGGGVKKNALSVQFHKKKHSRFKRNKAIHWWRWNNGKDYWERWRKEEPLSFTN